MTGRPALCKNGLDQRWWNPWSVQATSSCNPAAEDPQRGRGRKRPVLLLQRYRIALIESYCKPNKNFFVNSSAVGPRSARLLKCRAALRLTTGDNKKPDKNFFVSTNHYSVIRGLRYSDLRHCCERRAQVRMDVASQPAHLSVCGLTAAENNCGARG